MFINPKILTINAGHGNDRFEETHTFIALTSQSGVVGKLRLELQEEQLKVRFG
jgi:hypothetical protein